MRLHQSGRGRNAHESPPASQPNRLPGSLSVPMAIAMFKPAHAWKLSALLLICAGMSLHAQELTFLDGTMTELSSKNTSYSWQLDYRQDFFQNFASSVAYINEGHVPGHYRDGEALEAWGNLPLFNDRIAVSLGAGRSEEHTSELQSPMYLVCRL